jgi:CTP synthase
MMSNTEQQEQSHQQVEKKPMKYIVVTGGVISGVGKGIIASSTGVLLKSMGQRVTAIKIDPYLNIDAGTLSPYDHGTCDMNPYIYILLGEVFMLEDGGEVDLDLGNYERFLNVRLSRDNNITTGKVYQQVIERERRGDYLGKTVQVVPHVTDAIQDWIERVARVPVDSSSERPDVCIIELGGTVGDIESAPFIEALRQFQFRVGLENFMVVHVSLVPVVGAVGEQKTKPTQSSVRDLRGLGLSPDVIACRSSHQLEDTIKEKISMFCHVGVDRVVAVHDCASVYHVPMLLEQQGLGRFVLGRLGLGIREAGDYWAAWQSMCAVAEGPAGLVNIAVVGKYTYLQDSYLSIKRALDHAAMHIGKLAVISWIEASDLEEGSGDQARFEKAWKALKACNGIIVPGGFGDRGTLGKLAAINYARLNAVPILGICLGYQLMVIEASRNMLGWSDANSTEMDEQTAHPVVIYMPEVSKTHLGGTMRCGARPTTFIQPNSKSGNLAIHVFL